MILLFFRGSKYNHNFFLIKSKAAASADYENGEKIKIFMRRIILKKISFLSICRYIIFISKAFKAD
jgi:hypothetical protein